MKPADMPGAIEFRAPPGMEDTVYTLPVFRFRLEDGTPTMTSAWELTIEEVAEINRSGRLFLTILGMSHPPVLLTVTPPFETKEVSDADV